MWKAQEKNRKAVLLSVLLIACSSIMAGCPASRQVKPYKCEQPELRGDTWADVAILSIEQRAEIEKCNIRNGVDDYDSD